MNEQLLVRLTDYFKILILYNLVTKCAGKCESKICCFHRRLLSHGCLVLGCRQQHLETLPAKPKGCLFRQFSSLFFFCMWNASLWRWGLRHGHWDCRFSGESHSAVLAEIWIGSELVPGMTLCQGQFHVHVAPAMTFSKGRYCAVL